LLPVETAVVVEDEAAAAVVVDPLPLSPLFPEDPPLPPEDPLLPEEPLFPEEELPEEEAAVVEAAAAVVVVSVEPEPLLPFPLLFCEPDPDEPEFDEPEFDDEDPVDEDPAAVIYLVTSTVEVCTTVLIATVTVWCIVFKKGYDPHFKGTHVAERISLERLALGGKSLGREGRCGESEKSDAS
jgi:hypothetical protein